MNTAADIISEYTKKEPPIDVQGIATSLGLSIKYTILEQSISGFLEKEDTHKYCITVNCAHHDHRQRFTIAHEIGHFLLHRNLIGDGIHDNKAFRADDETLRKNPLITQRQEVEANKFAAALLMPKDRVTADYKAFKQQNADTALFETAKKWQVSTQSMKIRLGLS